MLRIGNHSTTEMKSKKVFLKSLAMSICKKMETKWITLKKFFGNIVNNTEPSSSLIASLKFAMDTMAY